MEASFFAFRYSLSRSSQILLGMSDSSSITALFLPFKHTRTKGPSLHRHYPASQVLLTLSDAQMIRHPKDDVPLCAKISETPFLPEFTVAGGEGKSHEETFEWCGTNPYGFSYA
jgi:hypothetical protein